MSKKTVLLICLLFFCLLWLEPDLYSQCAMCKENLQYDLDNGAGVGKNINKGILYIMAIPYVLMGVVGTILYKMYKTKKTV